VIPVLPPPGHIQGQIQLGIGFFGDLPHGSSSLKQIHPQLIGPGGKAVGDDKIGLVIGEDQRLLPQLHARRSLEAELLPEDRKLYVYERNYEGKKLLVVCSFSEDPVRFQAPAGIELDEKALVFGNYSWNFVVANGFTTRPYELRVYLFG
jgi:hypothetical protein